LILLAFLLPLAVYLVLLGAVNRRPHPLVVSGVWDCIGLLFATSGFLLLGGPAILSSLHERWRLYWLLGQAPGPGGEGPWPLWMVLSALYFLLVLLGSAWALHRRRHLTAIYNVEPVAVEQTLAEVCARLGLRPVRSGNLLLFGIVAGPAVEPPAGLTDGIPAPAHLATTRPVAASPTAPGGRAAQAAVLEVDAFPLMNHVTLRWDPADPPLRHDIEAALRQRLSETLGPASDLGGWLLLVGSTLLFGTALGAALLMLARLFHV
jgi:hypothetical protein